MQVLKHWSDLKERAKCKPYPYAPVHLQKLLAGLGFTDELDRQREFDAAVTRIRPSLQSIHKAKELALSLADEFTLRPQQKQVYAAVEQIMTSDNNISTWENTLLSELRLKFRL